jgi:ubiquinone/menaquinone biosynthesis C-methylase UbiE
MTAPIATPDLAAIKQRQQLTWSSGDYAVIGTTLTIMAEQLCETVDLRPGTRVLDVASGHGNTALAAARRWCDVTAIDYVPELLARGRERAAAERLAVSFQEGDAEAIAFPDDSFDVVLSTLGVMFAPNQEQAASELLRVCRPGGKIGLANWTPNGFIGEMFRAIGRNVPPPAGLKPPSLWGTEERLRELFGHRVSSLQTIRRNYFFRYRSPRHWLDVFRGYYGPMLKAFESLDPAGRERLAADLLEVAHRFNQSGDETFVAPGEYLDVVAVKSR